LLLRKPVKISANMSGKGLDELLVGGSVDDVSFVAENLFRALDESKKLGLERMKFWRR
jgi:hypothetical protein